MTTITLEPTGAALGAFVRGFDGADLATPEGREVLALLRDALFEHGVLIVRGQEVDPAHFVALGRVFGELELLPEPDKRHPDHPEIFVLSNVGSDGELVAFDDAQAVFLRGTERWHTDSSFRAVPALCTMLYGCEVPRRGGQTQFADMRLALQVIPPDVRDEMTGLRLVHSYAYSRENNPGRMPPMSEQERDKYPPVEHPWVRRHHDGSESLYMGGHASHIVGRDPDESRRWFSEIEAQLSVHDLTYEHQWQPHDLVIWDNRTLLHRLRPYDIANERRVMWRLTVAAETPPQPA